MSRLRGPAQRQSPRILLGHSGVHDRRRRALALVSALALPIGLLAGAPGRAASDVRFQINLSAPTSWWSDFADRSALMLDNAHPNQANWSSFDYITGGRPYGPTNPQLYTVNPSSIGAPTLVNALTEDRGPAVYQVPTNQRPAGISYSSWATARLLAAANSLVNTAYQHLHLPQFPLSQAMVDNNQFRWATTSVNGVMVGVSSNPNLQSTQQLLNGTPGNANNPNPYVSAYGKPSPGIDCTDFSAYIYNLALGIQMHSGTSNQVQFPSVASGLVGGPASAIVLDSSGSQLTPTFFYGPHYGTDTPNTGADLDGLISNFQPGDILYIGNRQGIVHAVVWLGAYGTNADGTPSSVPLVISSHDNTPAIFTTQNINLDRKSTRLNSSHSSVSRMPSSA